MFTSLKGKTCVVTGASSGIGKAMALTFGREGCNMVLIARSEDKIKAVADEIVSSGGKAITVAGDVKTLEDMKKAAQIAVSTFGTIDILLSNAGIFPNCRLDSMTDQDYDNVMDTNVKGMFHAARAKEQLVLGLSLPAHLILNRYTSQSLLRDHLSLVHQYKLRYSRVDLDSSRT